MLVDSEFNDDEDLLNMEIPPLLQSVTFEGGGERLVISHIEVENFKSYFGKRVIGPFHKCFTSIIGPNGSGKSNVIDALLFVFGYRASKIRSKKVSVLIHSSAGRDDLRSCSVTVHFCKINDNQANGGYTKVDGSNIDITRTAYKDNTSKYTINGRPVKFKDVADLLRANCIDIVHNRFLILQGEVEQISMMKPKAEKDDEEGMLEYLEDIIGSSRLKPFVLELHHRIEQINERRSLQVQRVQHAEKDKNQLDGPVREVLKLMRLENAVTCIKNKILLVKRLSLQEQLTQLEEQKIQADNELEFSQRELNEILQQAKQISKERQQLQNIIDKCDDAVLSVRKKKATQEQNIVKAENDLKRYEIRRNKLMREIELENEKVEELEKVPERSRAKIEELRRQLDETKAQIEELSPILMEKLEEVHEALRTEEQEKTKLEDELGQLSIKEDSLNSKLTLTQQRLLNLQSEEEAQRQKFDSLQADLLKTEEALSKQEKDLQETQLQIPELEATFEGKTSRLAYLCENEARFAGRIRELRRKYEELKQTEECFTSANKLLNRIMEAKRSGEIEGIFGRLGDLGAIDAKYDTAISINFPQLEYIVTDTVQTAQRCIELLKREQLGVSTFIALEKQQQYWRNIRAVPETPENAPRLFDLIRVKDEHVLPAFYYVLGETLVADDIVSGTRIAMSTGRRWRTVTLKGELIDVSGAMTGGGNPQTRSRIGREVVVNTSHQLDNRQKASTDQQLAELQQELNNAEAELNSIKTQHAQLEPELQKRRDDLKRLKLSVRELQIEIENSNTRIVDLQKQIVLQKQNVLNATANPEDVKNVKEEITSLTLKTTELGKQTDNIRSVLITLNGRMEAVDERIAGPHRERLRNAEELNKLAENGITKESATILSSERNLKKTRTKILNLKQDDVETQSEECSKIISAANDLLTDMESQLTQCNVDLDSAKQKLNEFINSASDSNDRELDLQRKISQLQHGLKHINSELSLCEDKLKTLSSKLSKLQLYLLKRLTVALNLPHEEDDELPRYSDELIREFHIEELENDLANLEQQKDKKQVNVAIVTDFIQKLDRYEAEFNRLTEITSLRDRYRAFHDKLKKQRLYEFMAGFQEIATLLRTSYQMITIQGDVSLELVDALDPFSEGIAFNVFALHHYKPTPLYVMDEIDAALDFRNVSIIANYLLERTRNAQFIVISLRNQMYEKADRLIGIYKINDCTMNVCLDRHIFGKRELSEQKST